MAGIFAWLDKHEYAFDAEMETNIDGWSLRRTDAGCELLRKLLDPLAKLPLHMRLFPNSDPSDPLTPAEYPGDTPAFYVPNQFFDNPHLDKNDRKLAIEDITQVMTRFFKGFIEVYSMADRNHADYEESIDRCQDTILRTFKDITGIKLKKKRIDAKRYCDYSRFANENYEHDGAGFPDLRKFFIMAGALADKFLEGQADGATNT